MTTYILLISWTDQGIKNVRDLPKRLDAVRKVAHRDGRLLQGSLFDRWATATWSAYARRPDDAVVARFTLRLGISGNVRTRTLKAFPEAAYRAIINSLG